MDEGQLFNLTTGIKFLKEGKKIRKVAWRKTFSWLEYHPHENCLVRYDQAGLSVKIYKDVDLENPGNSNDMDEMVWEIYETDFAKRKP